MKKITFLILTLAFMLLLFTSCVCVSTTGPNKDPDLPDLRVRDVNVSSSNLATGDSLTLSTRVENVGQGSADPSTLRWYLSTDSAIDSTDTQVGTDAVASLASGGTSSQSIATSAPTNPGIYYYGACVEAVSNEAVTTNNCSEASRVETQGLADLTVEGVTVSDTNTVTGQDISLSTLVNNEGLGNAPATTLRWYLSTDSAIDSTDTQVGTDAVASLASGGTSSQSITTSAPTNPGIYYYGACVEAVSNEAVTTNNCSEASRVETRWPADLTVDGVTVSDTNIESGQDITLSTLVSNKGLGNALATTLRWYLSTDSAIDSTDTQVGTNAVASLASGGTSSESIDISVLNSAGTYYYGACVEAVSDESMTDNNCSSGVEVTVNLSLTKILASDGANSNYFGFSVSISEDYAVVGAYGDDDNGDDSGSAYIFSRSGTSWSEQAKLTPSDGANNDQFGFSVSISGDFCLVGANGDDDNGDASGSAYIFSRSGTSWSEQAKLTPGDGTNGDNFGISVSISGDFCLVGANGGDDNGGASGSAYIFSRSGTSWSEQAKLTPGDGTTNDQFGVSVSISGDYAVVGSWFDDDNGESSGSAYIFSRSGTSWSEQAKLTPGDGTNSDLFGFSVSISEDYVLVGANGDDDNGGASGSAYIFSRSGTSWSEQAKLTPGDGTNSDNFGVSVSISGDFCLVGANGDDDNGDASGSTYIFSRSGTSWSEQAKLTPGDGTNSDNFGVSVSIFGDYALMGAYLDDDNGDASGSTYIVRGYR